jgi:hypothetical protein
MLVCVPLQVCVKERNKVEKVRDGETKAENNKEDR